MPLARWAVYQGAPQIWVAPTADDSDGWLASVRHIAIESGAFVVSVPQYIPGSAFPDDFPAEIDREHVYGRGGAVIVEPTWGERDRRPAVRRRGDRVRRLRPARGPARQALVRRRRPLLADGRPVSDTLTASSGGSCRGSPAPPPGRSSCHAGTFRRRKPTIPTAHNPPRPRSTPTAARHPIRRRQQRHVRERRDVHHPVRQPEQRPEERREVARRQRPPDGRHRSRQQPEQRDARARSAPTPRAPARPTSRRAAAPGRGRRCSAASAIPAPSPLAASTTTVPRAATAT